VNRRYGIWYFIQIGDDDVTGADEDVFSQELDQDEHAMRFMPHENGVYYVNITFNEAHIPGSPFPMLVGKLGADPALVFAKGEGLEKGEVGTLDIRILCSAESFRFLFCMYIFVLFYVIRKEDLERFGGIKFRGWKRPRTFRKSF